MADDAWANNGNGNGRTPSPRREDAPADFREPSRDQRDDRGDRGDRDRQDYRPSARGGDASVNPGNNLHVRGLSMQTTENDLEDIFSKFGAIEKCQIMTDPRTRESRGFAFVTLVEPDAASEAMKALNGTTLDNRTLVVEMAKRGRARTPTPGQYQGPEKNRSIGFGGDRRGGYEPRRDRDYPPRRYDDDRRAAPMRGGDRDYRSRDDDRPPRRDYDDRAPRRDYDDRRPPPRRDGDRRDDEPRRERREPERDGPRRY